MGNWYIARATNMKFANVSLNLLDCNHWNDQQNHSAIPSALADWGFLNAVGNGVYEPTELGRVVMSAKWHWREVLLHALAKRGSGDPAVQVRPIVAMAKVLLTIARTSPQDAYLTSRSFTRLAYLSSYAQITDSFCEHLNEPDLPGEPNIFTYHDIWLNALDASGILEKVDGKYLLRNNRWVKEFLQLLVAHGDTISECPSKDDDPQGYYAYMGDVSKGLPEILSRASPGLLYEMFPSYERGAMSRNMLAPQQPVTLNELIAGINNAAECAGLNYPKNLVGRFVSAVTSRPFVVLTGLSGSGKTKLAQSFVEWLSFNLLQRENCFYPGLKISRANTDLEIMSVDNLGMVVAQGNGTQTVLSHELVDQWMETIVSHGYTLDTPTATVRETVIGEHPQYSPYMHRFDSTLKPLAFYKLGHASVGQSLVTRCLIPVGADWTNSEKLLGYPNALDNESYVMPDSGVLKLMMDAEKNPRLPFFLILDEMNLSHVERYFADFLSAMESGDEIKLYDGDQRFGGKEKTLAVPRRIRVPKNLFVIGTMNVDETTYMFSPKVLDRAQVIEFRVSEADMQRFTGYFDDHDPPQWHDGSSTKVDLSQLADANGVGKGAKYAESFLELSLGRDEKKPTANALPDGSPDAGRIPLREVAAALNAFFKPLSALGAEFGYRSASEIMSFCGFYLDTGAKIDEAIDAAVVQKLLPKVHGSRRKLEDVLETIWKLSLKNGQDLALDKDINEHPEIDFEAVCKYPLTAEKVFRMRKASLANGFASFAEA